MKIHHTGIYVKDLESARDFFVKYFGFTSGEKYHNSRTGFSSYMLSLEGDASRLELMHRIEALSVDLPLLHLGPHHINICIGSEDDVNSLSQRLAEDGYEILDGPRRTGDGFYECCIKGVDGLLIEISAE